MYGMWNSKPDDFTMYSLFRIPFNKNLYYIETSQVIYSPMKINWMVLIDIQSLTQKGLNLFEVVQSMYLSMYLFADIFSE